MSFQTRVFDLITTLRNDLRSLQSVVDGIQSVAGTAPASETVTGTLEIATQAETNAGVSDSHAVTPLKFHTRLLAYAQPLNSNLTTLAGVASGAFGRTLLGSSDASSAKTSLALTKTDVGLSNVDNTSDANKPVSSAQQTALNLKADTSALPTKASLGLANVDNTSDASKPISSAQQAALNLKADISALPTKTSLGLANVDNTSDANKPVSTAQQAALNLKANVSSLPGVSSETAAGIVELATQAETNTGTDDSRVVTPLKFQTRLAAFAQPLNSNLTTLAGVVSGAMGRTLLASADAAAAKTALSLTKSDVGLSNVDNTSDTNKPVSTAQQTALNLKANLASPALTGVPTAPTAAVETSTTQIATTAFVHDVALSGVAFPSEIDGGTP